MTGQYINATITGYKRLNNSIMGNPQYEFELMTTDGTVKLRTKANSGFVYALLPESMVGHDWRILVQGRERRSIVNFDLVR